jgi:anti-sigma factor RsiW
MKCKHYRMRLEEWLDGELDEDQNAAMEEHGGRCPDCALVLARRRALGAALKKDLHELTAGFHFRPPTTAELLAEKRRPGRPPWLHCHPREFMAPAAVALVILLLFFQPWTKPRQKSAAEKVPTEVITVSDSLNAGEESFISGRSGGYTYLIHLQVSAVEKNVRS